MYRIENNILKEKVKRRLRDLNVSMHMDVIDSQKVNFQFPKISFELVGTSDVVVLNKCNGDQSNKKMNTRIIFNPSSPLDKVFESLSQKAINADPTHNWSRTTGLRLYPSGFDSSCKHDECKRALKLLLNKAAENSKCMAAYTLLQSSQLSCLYPITMIDSNPVFDSNIEDGMININEEVQNELKRCTSKEKVAEDAWYLKVDDFSEDRFMIVTAKFHMSKIQGSHFNNYWNLHYNGTFTSLVLYNPTNPAQTIFTNTVFFGHLSSEDEEEETSRKRSLESDDEECKPAKKLVF